MERMGFEHMTASHGNIEKVNRTEIKKMHELGLSTRATDNPRCNRCDLALYSYAIMLVDLHQH
jgi:hypothetical protein